MSDLPKSFRPLPDYELLSRRWLDSYDANYAERGLAARIITKTHALLERPFGPERSFPLIVEVGAGTLAHLPFIRHQFDRYVASDIRQSVIDGAAKRTLDPRVELLKVEGITLPFDDDTVDRLVATHVLEHVPMPHLALAEWARVVKPGGVISIILPCDPGFAWRLGRHFGPRQQAESAGLPYDYFMAREHVNSIFTLRELLRFHFPKGEHTWWPLRLPSADLNLIYAANVYL